MPTLFDPGQHCPTSHASAQSAPAVYPQWLRRDLRSDHAGETGAVAIYQGILAITRDAAVREFARRHLESERRHLRIMEDLLPPGQRSRLLALCHAAGFALGAAAAVCGRGGVFATIDAVESFVDRHYAAQLDRLADYPGYASLRALLASCREDELAHRDEARGGHRNGRLARAWGWLVGLGSQWAVLLVRRF